VLGGVDWNPLTGTIVEKLQLPVRLVADWKTEDGQYFEVESNGETERYRPVLRTSLHSTRVGSMSNHCVKPDVRTRAMLLWPVKAPMACRGFLAVISGLHSRR
jgi:hypothetical protein